MHTLSLPALEKNGKQESQKTHCDNRDQNPINSPQATSRHGKMRQLKSKGGFGCRAAVLSRTDANGRSRRQVSPTR